MLIAPAVVRGPLFGVLLRAGDRVDSERGEKVPLA